nr:hybrid signal transduction histidine kinase M [Tanacetum cinerariifolium]
DVGRSKQVDQKFVHSSIEPHLHDIHVARDMHEVDRRYFDILSKSRDVLTVGSTIRIPLLYRGEYSQWVERFMNYLEEQTDGEAMINSIKNGSLGIRSHVKEDNASTNPDWCQLDDLIKMYIFGSLCDSPQEQVDPRALNLNNELRSIKIGKMTVNEYCTKIKSLADKLKNLGCVVSDKNLVIYTVSGLDSRFATLVEIIRHRETLPTFESTGTMLLLKESSFTNDSEATTTFKSSSSSPTVLMTSTSSSTKDPTWNMDTCATSHLNSNARNLSILFKKRLFSSIHVGDGNLIPVTNTGHNIISSYHRSLHLNNVLVTSNIIKNLISIRQFTRDNNYIIEFDAFGFSVKDFLTSHILLQSDSSGDLYPVTKPSILSPAFVSTSSTTWHQHLGHPGDEMLCSLSSRQFISCNKAKSTHVCHARQLGKHVKLPF